ncbi:hypothetical protein H6802_02930 [Candidatus Nomurabacteria bacterium]|uniref:Uncharacterized protein n=1 Tax=candidate division WWE3 bacterium TaxID=2053526 RepID=A0A955E0B1_UNCKA|nr:hypothetical protein [candidate division WWE3 bacterium]MCB9823888.1 hypothetical protein [Candidatus Nomurabacteria bacterium]MCB9827132.1 hypothetical protein [Candidatus Nomurabacteria bacterium]MCB9827827.1 hypothetical protein [Candidatus Nomurabacteria bacterium]
MKRLFVLIVFIALFFTAFLFLKRNVTDSPVINPPLVNNTEKQIPENYLISLQVGEIDTRISDPMVENLVYREHAYVLVQVKDPMYYDEVTSKLEKLGAKRYGYVPNYSYIFYIPTNALNEITSLEEVQWVGWYYPKYKTTLTSSDIKNSQLTIMMFPDEEKVIQAVATLDNMGKSNSEYYCDELACTYTRYALDSGHSIEDITDLEVVMWVERYVEPSISPPTPNL